MVSRGNTNNSSLCTHNLGLRGPSSGYLGGSGRHFGPGRLTVKKNNIAGLPAPCDRQYHGLKTKLVPHELMNPMSVTVTEMHEKVDCQEPAGKRLWISYKVIVLGAPISACLIY